MDGPLLATSADGLVRGKPARLRIPTMIRKRSPAPNGGGGQEGWKFQLFLGLIDEMESAYRRIAPLSTQTRRLTQRSVREGDPGTISHRWSVIGSRWLLEINKAV